MDVTLRQIVPNVFVFTFDTQYDLCMSFIRIQEFYESPEFKGKFFTLEEYMDWWAKSYGKGSFDYPKRWNGFNVPGTVFKEWVNTFANFARSGLRKKEMILVEMLVKRLDDWDDLDKIYIIGVNKEKGNRTDVIKHEVAHAMYTLYPKYKKSCDKLLAKIGRKKEGKVFLAATGRELLRRGYHKDVVKDEQQAFFSTSSKGDRLPLLPKFKENYEAFKKTVKMSKKKNKKKD